MTHRDFIAEVAKRLEWPEEKISGVIETILEVVSTELKMNNPVIIDDFGTLKIDIQPEYILVNPETKERYLMPPAVEVIFEVPSQENGENSSFVDFTLDEILYNEVNSSFSHFEPTPLDEDVGFPGIPEIVAGEPIEDSEVEEPIESVEPDVFAEDPGTTGLPEITEPAELTGQTEPAEEEKTESPPQYRSSRRGLRSNKRTSPVWIPIAGGIAIIVASLFFFQRRQGKVKGGQ